MKALLIPVLFGVSAVACGVQSGGMLADTRDSAVASANGASYEQRRYDSVYQCRGTRDARVVEFTVFDRMPRQGESPTSANSKLSVELDGVTRAGPAMAWNIPDEARSSNQLTVYSEESGAWVYMLFSDMTGRAGALGVDDSDPIAGSPVTCTVRIEFPES